MANDYLSNSVNECPLLVDQFGHPTGRNVSEMRCTSAAPGLAAVDKFSATH